MSAGTYDFTIEQAATFARSILWTDENAVPVDLTGYTAGLEIKSRTGEVEISLTDTDGITLGGAAGTIDLLIDAADTEAIAATTCAADRYRYDLLLTAPASGPATRLLQGKVTVSQAVTS